MNLKDLVDDRGAEHGNFKEQFRTSQNFKQIARQSKNWEKMPLQMREAIEMALLKISRICNGDFNKFDHWLDVAGYTFLIAEDLDKREEESNAPD